MKWDEESLFGDGDSYFAGLLRDLGEARRSIDLETYIFADDFLGRKVAVALQAAVARGVRVRVMADGFGSPGWVAAFAGDFVRAGIQARLYQPLPWALLVAPLSRFALLTRLLLMIANMNRRNHRKVCVIDGHIAWLGSMNIIADHLRPAGGGPVWRDVGVRLRGRGIAELRWAFERVWCTAFDLARGKVSWKRIWIRYWRRHPAQSGLVRLNATARMRWTLSRDLLSRFASAKRRIWVTSAYFVPNHRQNAALQDAARRGIDVRILVPQSPDVYFMRWIAAMYYRDLLAAGARLFEYRPSVLHAKGLLIDDDAIVGSSNMNHRSLIHDLEADVILGDPASLHALEGRFLCDASESTEVLLEDIGHRSWLARLAGRLLFGLRYWI